MSAAQQSHLNFHNDNDVTQHAWERMSERGISPNAVQRVIDFGRVAYVRGATIYAVGRKEVEHFKRKGIDLSELEGIQVVCTDAGVIMTVYRNRDFRGLRPRRRRRRPARRGNGSVRGGK